MPERSHFTAHVVEAVPDAVLACDRQGNLVVANRRARELHDLPTPPLSRERWTERYELYEPGAERRLATDELPVLRALDGAAVRDVELDVRAGKGRTLRFSVSSNPVFEGGRRIVGAVMVMRDVSGRRSLDAELRTQGSILANMAEGVALIGASDGRLIYVNDAWNAMFGYDAGELVGRHVSVVNAPTDRSPEEQATEIIDALARDGSWHGEVQNVRKDGTRFWTAANVSRLAHPAHGMVWVTVQTDITRRKRAAQALRESEERFRTVFEEGPLGVALVGTDSRVIDVNRAFCAITGYRRDELVGTSLADITHPEDRGLDGELARQVLRGEIPRYHVAKRYLSKHGVSVPVALTGTAVRGADGRPLCGVAILERSSEGVAEPELRDVSR